jgi:heat shock protein HslJ
MRIVTTAALGMTAAGILACGGKSNFPSPTALEPTELEGTSWRWLEITSDTETVRPPTTGTYTLTFGPDHRVTGTSDCNQIAGPYTQSGASLAIGPLAETLKLCAAGGMGGRYSSALPEATAHRRQGDTLVIELKGGGAMRFLKA